MLIFSLSGYVDLLSFCYRKTVRNKKISLTERHGGKINVADLRKFKRHFDQSKKD